MNSSFVVETTNHIRVDSLPIAGDLVAIKITNEIRNGPTVLRSSVSEMLTTKKILNAFKRSSDLSNLTLARGKVAEGKLEGFFCLMTADHLELFRKNTFETARDMASKCPTWTRLHHEPYSYCKELLDEKGSFEELIPVNFCLSAHMLFDLKGAPFPVGIQLSYSSGGLTSSLYNIEEAAKELETRPDVYPFISKGRPKSASSFIEEIPYYQEEEGSYLSFTYSPSLEIYRKAWFNILKSKIDYPSIHMKKELLVEMDALGLEKYRRQNV